MNDKERADALVERGIGSPVIPGQYLLPNGKGPVSATQLVIDDRAVMECMERMRRHYSVEEWCKFCNLMKHWTHLAPDGLPRAIIDAFLETDDDHK